MRIEEIQAGGGGWGGRLTRLGLRVLSGGYALGLAAHKAAYRHGVLRPERLPRPVISVGNFTAGGTGKTPFTIWLARHLLASGRRPGILARGYGARAEGSALSDEGAVRAAQLGPQVPQAEDPDRAEAGRRLLEAHPEVDVLLLDDGFQHWRLARDLDIVLVDATRPYGLGHLLPRGLLREGPRALARADVVVLTRADHAGEAALPFLESDLHRHTQAPIARACTRPVAVEVAGEILPPETLAGRRVFAFSAIARPEGFRAVLEELGAHVTGHRALRDHAPLDAQAWERAAAEAGASGAEWVVTTRKDWVKHPAGGAAAVVLDSTFESMNRDEGSKAWLFNRTN